MTSLRTCPTSPTIVLVKQMINAQWHRDPKKHIKQIPDSSDFKTKLLMKSNRVNFTKNRKPIYYYYRSPLPDLCIRKHYSSFCEDLYVCSLTWKPEYQRRAKPRKKPIDANICGAARRCSPVQCLRDTKNMDAGPNKLQLAHYSKFFKEKKVTFKYGVFI